MQTPCAVLSGDLIGSMGFTSQIVDRALGTIKTVCDAHTDTGFDHDPRFTRFRGDGWQVVLDPMPTALRLAIVIMATLKGSGDLPETRIAIGIGQVDSFGTTTLADAGGEAFTASGRGLDWLTASRKQLGISGPRVSPLHQIAVEFLMLRVALWTREQAEAAALYLAHVKTTGKSVADQLGVSPQAVSARLTGADAQRLSDLLSDWETGFDLMRGGDHG